MAKRRTDVEQALREQFIDFQAMRLKFPISRIAFMLQVHPRTVRDALHRLGFYADSLLHLHPIPSQKPKRGDDDA